MSALTPARLRICLAAFLICGGSAGCLFLLTHPIGLMVSLAALAAGASLLYPAIRDLEGAATVANPESSDETD